MIEIGPDVGSGITMLRFTGVQTGAQIVRAVESLTECVGGRDDIRLLCNWADVGGWTCEASTLPVYEWVAIASRVERAAILHHPRWNRQAAWLAALLRYGSADVRSWRPDASEGARAWLVSP